MMDNGVGLSAKVATQFTRTRSHHQHKQQHKQDGDSCSPKRQDGPWHGLMCLLRPPLRPLLNSRIATSSRLPWSDSQQRARTPAPPRLSGRSNDRPQHFGNESVAPAPSSSEATSTSAGATTTAATAAAEGSGSTHPSDSTSRNTKRRLPGEAPDQAVPVHKKTDTVEQK